MIPDPYAGGRNNPDPQHCPPMNIILALEGEKAEGEEEKIVYYWIQKNSNGQ